MTNREFYTAIAKNDTLPAELVDYATAQIEKLDATNEKRRAKNAENAAARAPYIQAVQDALTDKPQTATDVKDALISTSLETYTDAKGNEKPLSVQFISNILRGLVADGVAEVQDVKVKSKGTQKGYTVA